MTFSLDKPATALHYTYRNTVLRFAVLPLSRREEIILIDVLNHMKEAVTHTVTFFLLTVIFHNSFY